MTCDATRAAAAFVACCILGALPRLAATQIAFSSDREGTFDIHAIAPTGGRLERITDARSRETSPAWSPDATQIAYAGYTEGGRDSGIWLGNASAAGRPQLRDTRLPLGLSWSPRGQRWATMRSKSNSTTRYGVALIDPATGRRTDLAPEMFLPGAAQLSWSPTANRIAVLSTIVDVATGEFYQWIDGMSPGSLDWSQDGRHIAFQDGHHLDEDIYVAHVDGGNPRKVVEHPAWDGRPTWSPDGREIAFMSNRDGDYEIYVVDVETGALRNLTQHPAEDRHPDWAPDMKLLSIFAKELVTWGWMKGFRGR